MKVLFAGSMQGEARDESMQSKSENKQRVRRAHTDNWMTRVGRSGRNTNCKQCSREMRVEGAMTTVRET